MKEFIIWYVLPMAISLLTVLLCWKSERFAKWWVRNNKSTFKVLLWLSFVPIVNVLHSFVLLPFCLLLEALAFMWRHTFGKISISVKYPKHLK